MTAVQNAPRFPSVVATPSAAPSVGAAAGAPTGAPTAAADAPPPPPGPTTASAGAPPPGPPPHRAPTDDIGPGSTRGAFARFSDAPATRALAAAPVNEPLPPSSALQARLFR